MSPIGGLYTHPPPQWTVEIYLILRWRLAIQNVLITYHLHYRRCRSTWSYSGDCTSRMFYPPTTSTMDGGDLFNPTVEMVLLEPSRTYSREPYGNPGQSKVFQSGPWHRSNASLFSLPPFFHVWARLTTHRQPSGSKAAKTWFLWATPSDLVKYH